jgi:hypothetical protein
MPRSQAWISPGDCLEKCFKFLKLLAQEESRELERIMQ